MVADVLANGRKLYRPEDSIAYQGDPYMPVEFSVAAYRYGHSQVRAEFQLNAGNATTLFGLFGTAFRPLEPGEVVEWDRFFEIGGSKPQPARAIDTLLPSVLLDLPFINDPEPGRKSLAVRNLLRGKSFCLPSGQTIARYLCNRCDPPPRIYSQQELGLDAYPDLVEAPLWYYLLEEAALETHGAHLGRLGGRIVAEVLIGLLELDPMSYVHLYPCWQPELVPVGGKAGGGKGKTGKGKAGKGGGKPPGPEPGKPKFTFGDLLQLAGVA